MTCWSLGWSRGVVLWGENFTVMKLNPSSKSSFKAGGRAGALSVTNKALRGSSFSYKCIFMLGLNTLFIHSVKNYLITQALVLALHITFNLLFITFALLKTHGLSL